MDALNKGVLRALLGIALVIPAVSASAQGLFEQLQNRATQELLGGQRTTTLSNATLIDGLKEALAVGTERVTSQVGAVGGFSNDPVIRIPLPPSLRSAQDVLRRVGLSGLADDVEERLNKAAEQGSKQTTALFLKSIQDMTLTDARAIYEGPNDAATQYFRRTVGPELRLIVEPIIEQTLAETGTIRAYDNLVGQYQQVPFVPDLKNDLKVHATDKTLEGIFHYLAAEEAAIRENPAARTTDLLKQVFSQ